jgi:hypothetical protein
MLQIPTGRFFEGKGKLDRRAHSWSFRDNSLELDDETCLCGFDLSFSRWSVKELGTVHLRELHLASRPRRPLDRESIADDRLSVLCPVRERVYSQHSLGALAAGHERQVPLAALSVDVD